MKALAILKAFFGRNAIAAGLIAGFLALAMTYDKSRVNYGKALNEAQNAKNAGEANAKDFAAHNRARKPGAVERLQSKYCDDCLVSLSVGVDGNPHH